MIDGRPKKRVHPGSTLCMNSIEKVTTGPPRDVLTFSLHFKVFNTDAYHTA